MQKTTDKVRTGIFGGSFNPIHNGHVMLASKLLKAARLDEVWLLVTPQNPWKQENELMDDEVRLWLAKEAVKDIPGLVASDYEFHLPKPSYTWNTLQALSSDFPEREFVLLIGGDNMERFDKWYEHDKIVAGYDVVVYPRQGCRIDRKTLPPRVRVVRTPLINISSTDIRARIRQHLPIDHLVPPSVAEAIREKGLYAESVQLSGVKEELKGS
ncbi:MAG: nicotinate-nucleotide adenylyltransferase [Prevotella sp.]|nr:nicotinate-nucleotide adenylyltransferase [Prevotella sp.]